MASPFTPDKENYTRLVHLINDLGAKAFQETLDYYATLKGTIPGSPLPSFNGVLQTSKANLLKLKGPGKGKPITKVQWTKLYPGAGLVVHTKDLDITLCFVLLRQYCLCGLKAPSNGWDKQPAPADATLEGSLAQLKYIRNELAHSSSPELTFVDFKNSFTSASKALQNISSQLPPGQLNVSAQDIKKYEIDPLTLQVKTQTMLVIERWLQQEAQVEQNIELHHIEVMDVIKQQGATGDKQHKEVMTTSDKQHKEAMTTSDKQHKEVMTTSDKQHKEAMTTSDKQHKETLDLVKQQGTSIVNTLNDLKLALTPIDKCAGNADASNGSVELPSLELLEAWGDSLKHKYQSKYSEVNFVQTEDNPTQFDVNSDLYKPVQFMPIKMTCSMYSKRKMKEKSPSILQQGTHRDTPKGRSTEQRESETSLTSIVNMSSNDMETQEIESEVDDLKNTQSTKNITSLLTKPTNPKIYPILVEAEAGVGKTTLLHRLALDWANGDCEILKTFDLVFLVHLRRVKNARIEDVVCEDLELLPKEEKEGLRQFLQLKKDKVLYLIDGLDEKNLPEENEFLEVMREPGNHAICTSRPVLQLDNKTSPYGMTKRIHVKLLGFSDDTIHSYIKTYFHADGDEGTNKADNILDECRKHMFCKAIMRTPLYTGLICFLWEKHNYNLPDTATELFNTFLKEKLIIFWSKKGKEESVIVDFKSNPLERNVDRKIRQCLFLIAKLAFRTLVAGKVVFSIEDVDDCHLSLDDMTQIGIFALEDPNGSVIQFSHKLFHEYFAGLWLVQSDLEMRNLFEKQLFEILSRKHNLHHAFFFASGMSTASFTLMVSILKAVEVYMRDRMQDKTFISETQKMKCYIEVFKLQLIFEQGRGCPNKLMQKDFDILFETIPVHCSSAHSLAAAMTVIQTINPDCKHLTLIGGGYSDTEQIRCILGECQRRQRFNTIEIHHSDSTVIKELHIMSGLAVTEIVFYNCQVVSNVACLCNIFPTLRHITYDGHHSSLYKGNTDIHPSSDNPREIGLVMKEVSQSRMNPIVTTDTLVVTFNNTFEKCADTLVGCIVYSLSAVGYLKLSMDEQLRQEVKMISLMCEPDYKEFFIPPSYRLICDLFPKLVTLHLMAYISNYFVPLKRETAVNIKPARLLLCSIKHMEIFKKLDPQSAKPKETITIVLEDESFLRPSFTLSKAFADLENALPISIVSTLGIHYEFHEYSMDQLGQRIDTTPLEEGTMNQNPPRRHSVQGNETFFNSSHTQIPFHNKMHSSNISHGIDKACRCTKYYHTLRDHRHESNSNLNLPRTNITRFLEEYSSVPQIILGPFEITSDLCSFIESCLDRQPMSSNVWRVEGQVIHNITFFHNASIEDYFCSDMQWLEWSQFKLECVRIPLQKPVGSEIAIDSLTGVIRLTKLKIRKTLRGKVQNKLRNLFSRE